MRRRPTVSTLMAVTVGALAAALLSPATSGAVTFGANLNRAPDITAKCPDFSFYFFVPTCSSESINLVTGESGSRPPAPES